MVRVGKGDCLIKNLNYYVGLCVLAFIPSYIMLYIVPDGFWWWLFCTISFVAFMLGPSLILADGFMRGAAKKKIQAQPQEKDPILAKNRDPFLLLSQCSGLLLSVSIGPYEEMRTNIKGTWFITHHIETFVVEDRTFNLVGLQPDPMYGMLMQDRTRMNA